MNVARRYLTPVEDSADVVALAEPPHSVEAEQSVLGSLLLDNAAYARISDLPIGEDFYTEAHRVIFEHEAARLREGEPVDVTLLAASLESAGKLDLAGGLAYLGELVANVPTAANIRHYAEVVHERAECRRTAANALDVYRAAMNPLGRSVNEILAEAREAFQPTARDRDAGDALLYTFAHELDDGCDEADELVERLLTRGAMGVVYGDSNSGKTFFGIDIACAVARQITWMQRNVEPGVVVYLATESPASVRRRLRAYQRHHGCKVPNFVIVQSPIDLYNGGDDTKLVIDLVQALEKRLGVKCELVVGDTLSRLSAGANENSGEDMSIVVRHVDRIRHECRVHFLLIHHTGKDAARGMRGWSGMRAATDTEIEITTDEATGTHAAEVTKQRDIPGKGDRIGFRLEVVEMGVGKWGKPITSCIVVGTDAPPKKTTKVVRRDTALDALRELISELGEKLPGTSTIPPGVKAVTLDQWRARWLLRTGYDDAKPESARVNFDKDRRDLLTAGKIAVSKPHVWIV